MAHVDDIIQMAEYYATLGWVPIPTYGIKRKRGNLICSCGKDCSKEGKKPGKHPIFSGPKGHGKESEIKKPQDGVDLVLEAAERDPDLNLALMLGRSRLVVVDLDGDDGIDAWHRICEEYQADPFLNGPIQLSGSGAGLHMFLDATSRMTFHRDLGNPHVELKSGFSLIHVYPSRHISGGRYEWVVDDDELGNRSPGRHCLAPAPPDWLMQIGSKSGSPHSFEQKNVGVRAKDLRKTIRGWDSKKGIEWGQRADVVRILIDYNEKSSQKNAEKIIEALPDGSRLDILQIMQALARNSELSTIKAENVLEPIHKGLIYRKDFAGFSTGYQEALQMLREAQKEAQNKKHALLEQLKEEQEEEDELGGKLIYKFDIQGNRSLVKTDSNIAFKLKSGPWRGVLGFNNRTQDLVYLKDPPLPKRKQGMVLNLKTDALLIANWFSEQPWGPQGAGWAVKSKEIKDVLDSLEIHSFDPVKDYLDALEWDGQERVARCFIEHGGAHFSEEDQERYTEAVTQCWFIGAIARTYEPGCQMDTVIVLESPSRQGIGKSQTLRTLCKDKAWFGSNIKNLTNKDAYIQLLSKWIVEFGEMKAIKNDVKGDAKDFITNEIDGFRPLFEKRTKDHLRRCVFAGNADEGQYLVDHLNRRYWPIRVEKMDVEWFEENRDQLWAEAKTLYFQGLPWHLDEKIEELARHEQEERRLPDVLEDFLQEILLQAEYLTSDEFKNKESAFKGFDGQRLCVVDEFLRSVDVARALRKELGREVGSRRIAQSMQKLGWVLTRKYVDGVRTRGYSRNH